MRTEANAADKESHNGYIIQSSHFFPCYCYARYKKQEYLQLSYLKIQRNPPNLKEENKTKQNILSTGF